MTSKHQGVRTFTLTELGESLQSVIDGAYKKTYWVKAEIVKLNYYPKSGHCYPDLVDKVNQQIKAQFRGFIRGVDYQRIQKEFQDQCQSDLKSGMKVLMKVKVQFHALHGLSLSILDIDAHYTIGEMTLNRAKTIKKLKAEGVFYNNTLADFPDLPKKIAVISVETSKGYQDFMNILSSASYDIEITLFPALLQGDQAIQSIQHQLKKIGERQTYFDVVAIIRGGGGEIGLDCYDAYSLAKMITQFTIPVLAGIGHAANVTVTEMVAHKHFITPTDLAYFIVGKFDYQKELLTKIKDRFLSSVNVYLQDEKEHLSNLSGAMKTQVNSILQKRKGELQKLTFSFKEGAAERLWKEKYDLKRTKEILKLKSIQGIKTEYQSLDHLQDRLKQSSKLNLDQQKQTLKSISTIVKLTNPEQILKRGYSLPYDEKGNIIMSSKNLKPGDKMITKFKDGEVKSVVN